MVDRAALEMRSTGNRTGGSNPSLSAIFCAHARKAGSARARHLPRVALLPGPADRISKFSRSPRQQAFRCRGNRRFRVLLFRLTKNFSRQTRLTQPAGGYTSIISRHRRSKTGAASSCGACGGICQHSSVSCDARCRCRPS